MISTLFFWLGQIIFRSRCRSCSGPSPRPNRSHRGFVGACRITAIQVASPARLFYQVYATRMYFYTVGRRLTDMLGDMLDSAACVSPASPLERRRREKQFDGTVGGSAPFLRAPTAQAFSLVPPPDAPSHQCFCFSGASHGLQLLPQTITRSFIRHMMVKDPPGRYTAGQALQVRRGSGSCRSQFLLQKYVFVCVRRIKKEVPN